MRWPDRYGDMVSFSTIVADLQEALQHDMPQIRFLLLKNPAMAYTRIVEIGRDVGLKYGIQ